MARPPTRHLTCPFPPCAAEWWFGDLGRNVIPSHMPKGTPRWYKPLRCPGSLTRYLPDSDILLPLDAEKMARANAEYRRQLTEHPEYIGFNLGRPPNFDRPREDYFPGRPADAPEPGVGEASAQPVQIGTGHHLGKAAMDNAHSTTKGLADLAINQMGMTQDLLSRITNALDEAEAIAVAAESQIDAVSALVTSAVGTGADAGQNGEAMAEQTALAKSTIAGEGDGGNILNAITVAKVRVELAHQQLTAAATAGQAYSASLGRA